MTLCNNCGAGGNGGKLLEVLPMVLDTKGIVNRLSRI